MPSGMFLYWWSKTACLRTKEEHHPEGGSHWKGGNRTRLPVLHGKTVLRQPVFELVAAKCHRHLALKWVRVLPGPKRSATQKVAVAEKGGNRTRLPVLHGKTVLRQPVFELVAAKCHWHLTLKWVFITDLVLLAGMHRFSHYNCANRRMSWIFLQINDCCLWVISSLWCDKKMCRSLYWRWT